MRCELIDVKKLNKNDVSKYVDIENKPDWAKWLWVEIKSLPGVTTDETRGITSIGKLEVSGRWFEWKPRVDHGNKVVNTSEGRQTNILLRMPAMVPMVIVHEWYSEESEIEAEEYMQYLKKVRDDLVLSGID